jgi:hypothetical protein
MIEKFVYALMIVRTDEVDIVAVYETQEKAEEALKDYGNSWIQEVPFH